MAEVKPDTITEKDRRVINGLTEHPEYTARQMCEYLEMSMSAYLGTTRKPAFKLEMDKLTNDLLEVTRFQRTTALINSSPDSVQASKLVAEMAGEVGRNSTPLETGKDQAQIKTVSQIYKDLQTGKIISIPDLNEELRADNPPKDKTDLLPNCAESVIVLNVGEKRRLDCANVQINQPVSTEAGKARAAELSKAMSKELAMLCGDKKGNTHDCSD